MLDKQDDDDKQQQQSISINHAKQSYGTIQTRIKRLVNQLLSYSRTIVNSDNLPFIGHTNFKIIVFLSVVLYSYYKVTRVNPQNLLYWRIADDLWLIWIYCIKLYYGEPRSDIWSILKLLMIIVFNKLCGGSTHRTLQEDFFFSCSGNLFLSYFFL
jgi:hypothetical protein